MPSSARKSSVGGARRSIQKAHIPYRGDNPEVGKKTGIAVQHVERMSDGFEPFEELLQQADKRPPPKPKGRKSTKPKLQLPEFDEEDGELSMDIDDSPVRYLSNARIPSTPISKFSNASTRAVSRTINVDFEEIPSPRPRPSISRTAAKAGPSRLANRIPEKLIEPDSDSDNEPADYDDDMDMTQVLDGQHDYGDEEERDESPPRRSSPRRKSFAQIDEENMSEGQLIYPEEDLPEEPEEPEEEPQSPARDKGKRKVRLEDIEEEEEVEDEIVNGQYESEHEQEPSPPPKKKQKRGQEEPKQKKTSTSKKENREIREGVRRSKREHYKPLEWWRGEKVVYGRTNHTGPILVPTIKEIRRIPTDAPQPLGAAAKKKRRGSTRARSKSRAREETVPLASINPEEGWDDDTEPFGEVWDVDKQAFVRRRIAWTTSRLKLSQAGNNEWLFEKVFGDSDFVAAGHLVIPPGSRKPTKATKDNTYIFLVMQGAVNFKVHDVSKVLSTGGIFIAPRGNTYFIENISQRDAKLFFTQARKVPQTDEGVGSVAPTTPTQKAKARKDAMEVVRSSSPSHPPASSTGGRVARSLPPASRNQIGKGKRAPSAKI